MRAAMYSSNKLPVSLSLRNNLSLSLKIKKKPVSWTPAKVYGDYVINIWMLKVCGYILKISFKII